MILILLSTYSRTLESVAETETETQDSVTPDTAVPEHKPRTDVKGDLKRNVEGVLKSEIAHDTGIDRVGVIAVENRNACSGTAVESPGTGAGPVRRSNHKVVDTVNVESVCLVAIVKTKFELKEVGATCIVFITEVNTITDADTECLWLRDCYRCTTEKDCKNQQCFFHNRNY